MPTCSIITNGVIMIGILKNGWTSETMIYIVAFLLAVLISISVHEYAHAYIANKMGDDTAKRLGRLTLNPIAHFDVFGLISFLLVGFGWAKPVPINPVKFTEYRKGIFLTSVAGIVANLFLAFFSTGLYVLFSNLNVIISNSFISFLMTFLQTFSYELVAINLSLAVFNLIPIAPLDGFNLLFSLTREGNKFVNFISKYGYIILLVLIITPVLQYVVSYVVNLIYVPFLNFWDFVWVY